MKLFIDACQFSYFKIAAIVKIKASSVSCETKKDTFSKPPLKILSVPFPGISKTQRSLLLPLADLYCCKIGDIPRI
jgi:hypothetical protein